MTKKRKAGRPRSKQQTIQIRLSKPEYRDLRSMAKAQGISVRLAADLAVVAYAEKVGRQKVMDHMAKMASK